MMDVDDDTSSTAPERALDRHPFRGKIQTHQNSWQTEECLNPVRGLRDWQKRNGIEPHDHHRDNIAAIRARSFANRQQRREDARQAAAALPPFTPDLPPRRTTDSLPRAASTRGTDFVHRNAVATQAASLSAKQRRASEGDDEGLRWLRKQDFGRVPSYLQARKLQLAADHAEAERRKVAQLVPEGMRIMPEEERLEMLELLAKGKQEVEAKIQALPFVIETVGQKQRATALAARLAEIEEAVAIFSRKTVLVEL